MIGALVLASTLETRLDQYFSPHARRGTLAVAVVQDGQPLAVRTYGARPDAVFRMASLSKVVTALAVVRSGADLHAPTRYGVTLHDLLTHTSGIDDAFFGNTVPIGTDVPLDEHFRRRPPRFGRPAGETVVYSNEGMTLAGHLIERNARFEQVVARTALAPLGMTRSSFAQPPPFPVVPSGAEDARLVQSPAGAMSSTAADMAKLLVFLLSENPAAVTMRTNRYGLFEYGGSYFHTGRSGHESVLYLSPERRLGLFLVHSGGLGPELRRDFVRDFGGWRPPPPSRPRVRAGTYRPILFPVHRIERLANLGADTAVRVSGDAITVGLPPFAAGDTLIFENGVTRDGFVLAANGDRFTITGPLFEPLTFERVTVSGRMQLVAALVAFVAMLAGGRKFLAIAGLFALAPALFVANYFPRGPQQRPFHVETGVSLAVGALVLAAIAALATPLIAWNTRRGRHAIAAVAAVFLGLFVLSQVW